MPENSNTSALLEHANITVSDPARTAQMLCRLWDWKIRWEGEALQGGYTIHVGSDSNCVALYSRGNAGPSSASSYEQVAGLNHLGLVVPDLDETERRVRAEGFTPTSFADYEPGNRFYMHDADGIEFEFVSY